MEGRSSPRVKVKDIPAVIRRRAFPFRLGSTESAKVIDIGPKGLTLACEAPLETNGRLTLHVLVAARRTIKCAGIVRNLRKSDRGYLMGIEFTKLSNRDRQYLAKNILQIAEIDVLETWRMLKDRVRGLRNSLELTLSELSDLTGVPTKRIVQIEYGMEKAPPEEILESLAAGLGVSLEDLTGDVPGPEEELTAEDLASRYAAP